MRARYLLRRFQNHRSRVLELIESDRQVAEISEEYAEVCKALKEMEAEGKGGSHTASELRRLQSELEDEVSEALKPVG